MTKSESFWIQSVSRHVCCGQFVAVVVVVVALWFWTTAVPSTDSAWQNQIWSLTGSKIDTCRQTIPRHDWHDRSNDPKCVCNLFPFPCLCYNTKIGFSLEKRSKSRCTDANTKTLIPGGGGCCGKPETSKNGRQGYHAFTQLVDTTAVG